MSRNRIISIPDDAFNDVFRLYYARCVAFARSYVQDNETAESIASDSLLVFWQKTGEGADIPEPLPFLFGVVKNKALNHLRSQMRSRAAMEDLHSLRTRELAFRISSLESCDPHSIYESEIRVIIEQTLSEIGERQAKAFRLSRYDGLSYGEIADKMGISEKSVEYNLGKVLALLRERLKNFK